MGIKNITTGITGEDYATEYLVAKGYKIIARNYREKYGEIDIIARDTDRTLIFVEVKTMETTPNSNLMPEDNLTASKRTKLKKICQAYANKFGGYTEEKNWQIDLVAVRIEGGEAYLNHYKNII